MKFKNDKQRIAFLVDYQNKKSGWYIWKEDSELQRRWWRFDLPDCALIVEEDQRTYEWPDTRVEWAVVHWYIIKDWTFKKKTFRDQVGSRSEALRELRRIEKEGKEK